MGFRDIRLHFELDGELTHHEVDRLRRQTERYCVAYQTIRNSPPVDVTASAGAN